MARRTGEQRRRLAALADRERRKRRLERAGLVALRQRGLSEIDRRMEMARVEGEGAAQMRRRLRGLVCRQERRSEARMGRSEIRLEARRRGKFLGRLGIALAARQHGAEIVARLARLRSQRRGRAARGLGLLDLAECDQGVAEVEPRAEMIGLERGGLPVARRCRIAAARRFEDNAEIVVEVGDAAVCCYRPLDEADRSGTLALLMARARRESAATGHGAARARAPRGKAARLRRVGPRGDDRARLKTAHRARRVCRPALSALAAARRSFRLIGRPRGGSGSPRGRDRRIYRYFFRSAAATSAVRFMLKGLMKRPSLSMR